MSQLAGGNQAVIADEGFPRGQHALLAVGGQGNVGRAGVAAVERPLSLAVADDEDAGGRHVVVGWTAAGVRRQGVARGCVWCAGRQGAGGNTEGLLGVVRQATAGLRQ